MNSEKVDTLPIRTLMVNRMPVEVYTTRQAMGAAAGAEVAERIRTLLRHQERVRMAFAAAPSQEEFLAHLAIAPGIDWFRITAFHLDEYLGLPAGHPAAFGTWLNDHLFAKVRPGEVYYLSGSTTDPAAQCRRYAELLAQKPLDLACIGIGENGHIAFNDPPAADFRDPEAVKLVELEERCRIQQVNDGCFPRLDLVPRTAITLTVPTIMSARGIFCIVPGGRKARAVKDALRGPVSTECPASILRQHREARMYLDVDSAALL